MCLRLNRKNCRERQHEKCRRKSKHIDLTDMMIDAIQHVHRGGSACVHICLEPELLKMMHSWARQQCINFDPGLATPLLPYGPLRPNVTSSIKPEVHNISQCHQRRIEPRPQGICVQNFVLIGPAVPEICSRTDRQTDGLIRIHRTPTGAE